MNAMEFESDVEQDTAKMKSFLDVGVNKLSGSDNSVNNKIENQQPNSQIRVINSNIRGLGRGCLLPYMKLNKLSRSDNSVRPLQMTSNAFFTSPNNVSNMVENRYSGSQPKMENVNSEATTNLNFFSSQIDSLTSLSAPAHENGASPLQGENLGSNSSLLLLSEMNAMEFKNSVNNTIENQLQEMNQPQLNTAVESSGVLLASASQNGSMNTSMELKSDVEQETFKLKSILGVGVNMLSGSDSSVITPVLMTPDGFLNSPNNVNNKRENPQSASQPKIDILQSFVNSSVNSMATNNVEPKSSLDGGVNLY